MSGFIDSSQATSTPFWERLHPGAVIPLHSPNTIATFRAVRQIAKRTIARCQLSLEWLISSERGPVSDVRYTGIRKNTAVLNVKVLQYIE